MGDAPRHIAPGGAALGRQQPGDVVEGQHQAALRRARGAHSEAQGLARAHQIELSLGFAGGAAPGGGGHRLQLRRRLRQGAAQRLAAEAQQLVRLLVGGRDAAGGVQADDAGADAGQHCLDEFPPGFGLDAGGHQRRLLRLKIVGHLVESTGQDGDLFGIVVGLHPGGQIAAGDPVGRRDQPGDGRRDGVGRRHAEPHCPHQHQKHGLRVGEQEHRLDLAAVGVGVAVGGERSRRGHQVAEHARLDPPDHIEIGVVIGLQLVERPEQVGGIEVLDDHLAVVGGVHGLGRRADEGRGGIGLRIGEDPALVVDDVGGREVAVGRLSFQQPAEGDRIAAEQRRGAVQVRGHGQQVAVDVLGLDVDIGPGDGRGILHHGAHALGKPVVHPPGDQGPEEHRHHDGRQHRGQGEHDDEAQVQPRAGVARTLADQPHHVPGCGGQQADDQDQIGQDHRQDGPAGRADRTGVRRLPRRQIDGGYGQQDGHDIAEGQQEPWSEPFAPAAPCLQRQDR